jgi:hypothetical protein
VHWTRGPLAVWRLLGPETTLTAGPSRGKIEQSEKFVGLVWTKLSEIGRNLKFRHKRRARGETGATRSGTRHSRTRMLCSAAVSGASRIILRKIVAALGRSHARTTGVAPLTIYLEKERNSRANGRAGARSHIPIFPPVLARPQTPFGRRTWTDSAHVVQARVPPQTCTQ